MPDRLTEFHPGIGEDYDNALNNELDNLVALINELRALIADHEARLVLGGL